MNSGSVLRAPNLKLLRESVEPILRSMRGGANYFSPNTPGNVPLGMQLVETFVIVIVFSIVMQVLEANYNELKKYNSLAVDIYPLTYNSSQTFIQDPSSCYPILEPSMNERNGSEYSYSAFINVGQDNFTNQDGFRHIFHKGSPTIYPLMAPGVFFSANSNTLRIYQNTTLEWSNYVDIPNIPLNKWFHLVVMLKGGALDVFINGNLANRLKLPSVAKLNYGNFFLLNGSKVNEGLTCSTDLSGNMDASVTTTYKDDSVRTVGINENKQISIIGAMRGYVSRVKYFAFALSYAQIDKLLRDGPSKQIYSSSKDPVLNDSSFKVLNVKAKPQILPFYQTDDWWTSDVHSGLGPQ
jgi:hypothetical protein